MFSFFGFGYRRGFSVCFALLRSDLRLVLLRAFMRGIFFLSFLHLGIFRYFTQGFFFVPLCLYVFLYWERVGGGALAAGGSGGRIMVARGLSMMRHRMSIVVIT